MTQKFCFHRGQSCGRILSELCGWVKQMADKLYNAFLIENDLHDARWIEKMLTGAKTPTFKLRHADKLATALRQLKQLEIDIVLLALSLPDCAGTDAVKKILKTAPDVLIIVLAGPDDEKVAIKSMKKGAWDYLLKSKLDSNLLLSSMRSAIERKQIEQTLRLAQFSIDRASESIFWIAPDAKFIYVNDAACRTLGYSKQELLKMTVHDIDPNYNPKNWPKHWKNLKQRGSAIIESQHRTKNGNLIPVEIIANYLKFGEKEYNCAFARDMSEHKRSGLALRMSEQRFRAIADYTYFWEVWVSPKGQVLWTNPAVERITGYSIEDLKKMKDYPVPLVYEDDRKIIAEAFKSALNGSSGKALEFRLRRKDGNVIWADISWQPIYDKKGSSQGHRESIRDITERKRAEEEVLKSQQMLQCVLDTIPVGVFWKDRNSIYLGCNQHFAEDAGLNSPDKIIGKNDYELGWEKQAEFYRADDALVIKTGKPKLNYEEPLITPDGTQHWVRTSKVPLRDLNGNVIGILGTYDDISERKWAEQAIRASEKRFRSVVQTASDAIITANSCGQITFWNLAAEDMFGYSADEIVGKPLTAIMPERYREAHLKGLSRLVKTGQPRLEGKIAEFEGLKKDGSEFPISLSIASWGIEEGMFFTAIIRDITKRKQIEQALRQSEENYHEIFNSANDFIVVHDAETGQIVDANQKWLDTLDCTVVKLKKLDVADFSAVERGYTQKKAIRFIKEAADGKPQLFEWMIKDKNGNLLWVEVNLKAVLIGGEKRVLAIVRDISKRKHAENEVVKLAKFPDENPDPVFRIAKDGVLLYANNASDILLDEWSCQVGQTVPANWHKTVLETLASGYRKLIEAEHAGRIFSFVTAPIPEADYVNVYGRDITERKEAEKEREQLMWALELKNKELESILYVASHDLRAPLVNIQGFSHELSCCCDLIHASMAAEKQIATLDREAQNALDETVPQALNFILTSADKMDSLLTGLLRLSRLGQAALNIKSLDMNEMMAQVAAGMEFQIQQADVSVKIEDLTPCMGDAAQINQVFTNLLDNALKHLDENRPGLIHIYGKSDNNQNIYCVEDNGIGIAANHQKKIFEIFHRLDPDKEGGQGLGLTIVKRILDRHNGDVWVESQPGKGSKFFVALPKA